MIEISLALAFSAFIAGIIMFLAPCTLPLVPAYLGIISGISTQELQDPERFKKHRWSVFRNGFFFVLGFSLVFIIFGSLLGLLGGFLGTFRFWLRVIGGIFIILFGLYLLGVFRLKWLAREWRPSSGRVMQSGGRWGSFLTGAIFASGWSPCVGPVLGSVLFIAGTQGAVLEGGMLLAIFSVGMAIPFLLVALFVSKFFQWIHRAERVIKTINIVAGIFLLFLGALLLTDNFQMLIVWGYQLFDFINYEETLLQYL